mmetsp:Transcript_67590/g.136120  ORF Transcript_67590/g.136120 Transcript_67590/m.136120 type:complete len:232 (+) Transcript_67590:85-780(+)
MLQYCAGVQRGIRLTCLVLLLGCSSSDGFFSLSPHFTSSRTVSTFQSPRKHDVALAAQNEPNTSPWWHVEVSSEFDSAQSYATSSSESLLNLAEREGFSPPSECRRGNCLSCAARLLPGSSLNFETDDVFLCNDAKARGYLLTCSSYVTGPGLKIELEKNHEASIIQYHGRFQDLGRSEGEMASVQQTAAWARAHPEQWSEAVKAGETFNPLLKIERGMFGRDADTDIKKG